MTYGAVAYAAGPYAAGQAASVAAGTGPTVAVEVAFTTNPGSNTPVWTDVSADLVDGSVTRGRQRELDRYQAGTMTVTLRNETRAYDPLHATGPNFGNVLPMKRIRVRATYAGVTYPVFDGFVDSWDQQYGDAANNWAVAVVTATDGFKVLSVAELESSAYAQEVIADSPVSWWRLGEPALATVVFDEQHVVNLNVVDESALVAAPPAVVLGTAGLISRDSSTAATLTDLAGAASGFQQSVAAQLIPTAGPLTAEIVYRGIAPDGLLMGHTNDIGTIGLSMQLSAGKIVLTMGGPTVFNSVTSVSTVNNNVVHHIAGVWDTDGKARVYIDGTLDATGTGTIVPGGAWGALLSLIVVGGGRLDTVLDTAEGVVDEPAIYSTALSAVRVAAHASTVTTPWNGDTPGARMNRILDAVGWPAGLREIDTGSSALQSAVLNMSALEHAQKVVDSEFGNLYMARDGTVRFEGRASLINQPNYETFGDSGSELGYVDLKFDYSDQLVRNDVSVSRNEGVLQRVDDDTSILSFLIHSYTRDGLIHNSDTVSLHAAEFFVSQYKDPKLRVTTLEVNPRDGAAVLFPAVLGRELTDRLTVKRRPQGVGSVISQVSVIEGISHDFSAKRWSTRWSLSPAYAEGFWQLGLTGFSELGETTRLYF